MSTSPAQASTKPLYGSEHHTRSTLGAEQALSCNDNIDRYGIPISPAHTNTNMKPFYGPLVSRELFEARWNAKFEDLLLKYNFSLPPINSSADELVQQVEYMTKEFSGWLPVLRCCLSEAEAMGLLAERENQETSKKGFSVLDQVSILRFHVQGTVREWRGCMRGGMLGGRVGWVELDRGVRGRMAGIIEEVDGLDEFGTGVRGDKRERARTAEVERQNSQEVILRNAEEDCVGCCIRRASEVAVGCLEQRSPIVPRPGKILGEVS